MTLPKLTLTRIEADAKAYSEQRDAEIEDKKYIHKKTLMFYAYQAGAKKEVERALELIERKLTGINDTITNDILYIAVTELAKYKEVRK